MDRLWFTSHVFFASSISFLFLHTSRSCGYGLLMGHRGKLGPCNRTGSWHAYHFPLDLCIFLLLCLTSCFSMTVACWWFCHVWTIIRACERGLSPCSPSQVSTRGTSSCLKPPPKKPQKGSYRFSFRRSPIFWRTHWNPIKPIPKFSKISRISLYNTRNKSPILLMLDSY